VYVWPSVDRDLRLGRLLLRLPCLGLMTCPAHDLHVRLHARTHVLHAHLDLTTCHVHDQVPTTCRLVLDPTTRRRALGPTRDHHAQLPVLSLLVPLLWCLVAHATHAYYKRKQSDSVHQPPKPKSANKSSTSDSP
jgi:hypothetical protein